MDEERLLLMSKTILIGIAGLIGTLLRYWLSEFVTRQSGQTFPWGTLVVNVVGCLLAGLVFNLTEERLLLAPAIRHVILIGLLGGFTTFSSYGLQTFVLLKEGAFGLATLNLVASNVLGLLMVWVGYGLAKTL